MPSAPTINSQHKTNPMMDTSACRFEYVHHAQYRRQPRLEMYGSPGAQLTICAHVSLCDHRSHVCASWVTLNLNLKITCTLSTARHPRIVNAFYLSGTPLERVNVRHCSTKIEFGRVLQLLVFGEGLTMLNRLKVSVRDIRLVAKCLGCTIASSVWCLDYHLARACMILALHFTTLLLLVRMAEIRQNPEKMCGVLKHRQYSRDRGARSVSEVMMMSGELFF